MSRPRIALVGLGGYADFYLSALLNNPQRDFDFVAGIDPFASDPSHPARQRLSQHGVPYGADLEKLLQEQAADLYCLCTPIHLHAKQTVAVLNSGASVLCEKPAASVIQDVDTMIAAEKNATGQCAIGFQWSFSAAIQQLKKDIIDGKWGAPRRFRSMIGWPRTAAYYGRNNWAGAQKNATGDWVLDSPVANATAHFLHNCFYVLGDHLTTSAAPSSLTAELYRANSIDNFDAAAIHCRTDNDVDIHFYTAHCVEDFHAVEWIYEFEHGTVCYHGDESRPDSGEIIGTMTNGEHVAYGSPDADPAMKIWHCLDTLHANDTSTPFACGPAAARSQVLSVNAAQESMPTIIDLPDVRQKNFQDSTLTYHPDILKDWQQCFARGCQPSELGLPRVYEPGEKVDLSNYRTFPSDPTLFTD